MFTKSMKTLLVLSHCILLALAFPVHGNDNQPGTVHGSTALFDHDGFKPHELPFSLPTDGLARAEFRSEEFYAVILKSAGRCAFTEKDRMQVQQAFLKNKVFMDRFGCDDDVEESITYSNVDSEFSFLAVYAGADKSTAKAFYEQKKLGQKFPGANIRKMQAILVYP